MLEAVKHIGGDPPVRKGAGYNEVYTATAGFLFSCARRRTSRGGGGTTPRNQTQPPPTRYRARYGRGTFNGGHLAA